ncbi:MAG: ParB/RepB/Spo0J family partition protein [Firmicutes bacterium]|nr:ParB/RepB/Spo0J family partition protein [Bacillota bacterium]
MGRLIYIPIDMIYPNPRNPRKNFEPEAMAELVASVRQVGILQPVVLVRDEDESSMKYRLVAGERRYRAALEAEIKKLPAVVRELTPEQELEVMIIENLQRRDVDPIEEAQGMKALLDEGGYTQEALAEKLGCSQSHIANRLRLLRLPDPVKENISRKILSAGHAQALLKLEKTPVFMKKAAEAIADEQVPVAKAAEAIAEVIANEGKPLFNDYNSKPEFKTDDCEQCESRMMGDRFGSLQPYCIKPSCWDKKQQEVRQAREQALADRVQKTAKKGQGVIELDKFNWDQYEEFLNYKTEGMDLTECEGCEHKKVAKKSYRDELTEACFQPSCFKKKKAAATREKNKEARDAFKEEVNKISTMAGLKAVFLFKKWSNLPAVVLDKPTLIYLAAMILASVTPWHDRKITRYQYLKNKYGWEHVELKGGDYGLTKNDWDTFRQLLETLTDKQLLELIFEWPTVAHGLDGATGWVLQQEVHPKEESKPDIYHNDKPEERELEQTGSYVCEETGRLKRCGECKNINEDRICSAFGFERSSLTELQHCQYYRYNYLFSRADDGKDQGGQVESRSYLDENGQEIFISSGLGQDIFGTFRRKSSGALQRVKSPAMPMVDTREEAEKNLQIWAEQKGLQVKSECEQSA